MFVVGGTMFLRSRTHVGISLVVSALAAMWAVGCGSSASKASDGGGGNGGAGGKAGGCVDKVGADYHVSNFFNYPDGICDTYGSFTLTVAAPDSTLLTNETFFRVDSTGTNLNSSAGHVNNGVWTTLPDAQNVPGNYVAHLFLATTANPGESDFLPEPRTFTLAAGTNTFYYFADSDDQVGGSYGFGLNLWLNGATAGSPGISALAVPPGGAPMADATAGCSPAFDGTCTTSADSLSWTNAGTTVTLTSFSIDGIGGANAPVDAGASD
jgi:hypothetical protein